MPAQLLSLPYTFGAKLGVVRHSSLVDAVFGCYGVTWDDMQRHANQPELCRKQLPPVSQHHRRFLVSGSSPAQQWSLLPPGAIHLCCGLFLWPPVVLGGPRDLQAVKAALAFFEAAFLRRQGESPDPAGVLFLAKALSALGHHKAVVDMVSCVLEGDPCVLESRRYPDRTDIGHLILVQLSSSIVQVAQKDPAMYSTAAMECLLDALAPYIDSPACDAVSTIGRVWLHALFPWQGAPPASAAAASLLPAHPFYRRLLRQQVLPTLDTHVKVLRPLLLHSLVRDADTSLVSAAVTLGMQGLRCGFPWRVDPEESAACDFLVYTLSSAPLPAALPNIASCCCCIAALSMYLDLSSHPGIMDKLSSAVNATSPSGSKAESPALSNTTLEDLSLLASAAQDMAASRTSMAVQTYGAGGGTNRDTSTVVQAFYNSNPFPVWSNAATAGSFSYKTPTQFLSLFLPAFECHAFSKAKPESMLIAGCGSGHEVVTALHDFTECSVVAIDLSSTNLVYAKRHISRKYSSLESRLTLGHADLLDRTALAQLPGQPFTHIQSVGVLHHLKDPAEGLASLCSVLAPGGTVHLGLYSSRGTQFVAQTHSSLQSVFPSWPPVPGYSPTDDELRQFRDAVLSSSVPGKFPPQLVSQSSFYALASLRDMLFHPQVVSYSLAEVGSLLTKCGLRLIGLSFPSMADDTEARLAYSSISPQDEAMLDLSVWQEVERKSPHIFGSMYLLYAQKSGAVLPCEAQPTEAGQGQDLCDQPTHFNAVPVPAAGSAQGVANGCAVPADATAGQLATNAMGQHLPCPGSEQILATGVPESHAGRCAHNLDEDPFALD